MEKCVTCHYYDRRNSRTVDGRMARAGQCRKMAPLLSPNPSKSYLVEGVWPTVRDDDWCGEWKILPRRPGQVAAAALPLAVAGAMAEAAPNAAAARPASGSRIDAVVAAVVPASEPAVAMAAD